MKKEQRMKQAPFRLMLLKYKDSHHHLIQTISAKYRLIKIYGSAVFKPSKQMKLKKKT